MGNLLTAPNVENSLNDQLLDFAESPKTHQYYFKRPTKIPFEFYKGIKANCIIYKNEGQN